VLIEIHCGRSFDFHTLTTLIWALSGASVTTNSCRASMQKIFPQTMEAVDESNIVPMPGYMTDNGAHYVQNNYGYPAPSNTFAIDQSLQMPEGVEEYVSNGIVNRDQRQENGTSSLPDENGTDDMINSNVHSTSIPTTLPTTQTQIATNTSLKRKSPDDTQEISTTDPQSGRKRSKVSRACDQCRRKKVQT